jgi:hypothetical protein
MIGSVQLALSRGRLSAATAAAVGLITMGATGSHPLSVAATLVFVSLSALGFLARSKIEARVKEIFAVARARGALPGLHALHDHEVDELDRLAVSEGMPPGTLRKTFGELASRRGPRRG